MRSFAVRYVVEEDRPNRWQVVRRHGRIEADGSFNSSHGWVLATYETPGPAYVAAHAMQGLVEFEHDVISNRQMEADFAAAMAADDEVTA
jgi:hypothetical protein